MRIRQLESILVDLPTIRAHRLANQTVTRLTLVVLRLRTDDGLEGLGEATTIGGLSYGEEAPETIKVVLDEYVAPLLVGQDAGAVGTLMASVGWKIFENLTLTVEGKDLNDPMLKSYATSKDQPRAFYKNGRQFYVGLRAQL